MTLTSTEIEERMTSWDATKYARVNAMIPLISNQINEYTHGGFSHQVKEEAVSFTAAGTSGSTALDHSCIIRGSLYVTSTDRSHVYYGDCMDTDYPRATIAIPSTEIEEYKVDYENGYIWALSTQGNLIPSTNGLVTYAYVDLHGGGKEAAIHMIMTQITNPLGIQSETLGPLSRSYTAGGGMDDYTRALLSPYRRVSFG